MADEGEFPKIDGEIFFASEINHHDQLVMENTSELCLDAMGLTGDFLNFQAYASDVGTHTDTFIFGGRLFSEKLASTAFQVADFTGATLDADYTLSTTGSGSATFDATNDEVDLNAGASGDTAVMEYTGSVSQIGGRVHVKFRNAGGFADAAGSVYKLEWGGLTAQIAKDTVLNADVELRITRTGAGIAKLEYSFGGGGFILLSTSVDTNAGSKPKVTITRLGDTMTTSIFFFEHSKLADGAEWISPESTLTSSNNSAFLNWTYVQQNGASFVIMSLSLDNQANFEVLAEEVLTKLANPGTQAFTRVVFTNDPDNERSSSVDFYLGGIYNT